MLIFEVSTTCIYEYLICLYKIVLSKNLQLMFSMCTYKYRCYKLFSSEILPKEICVGAL